MDFNAHARMQDLDAQFAIDKSQVDNIEFDDIDYKDSPDFCDAYIVSADHKGIEMEEDELGKLNEDRDFIHDKLIEYLY